jgi:DNA-binding CsgD family transcriptional regulator
MLPSVRDQFPAEASALEADCAWWYCCAARYAEAEEAASRALQEIGHAEMARRTWAVATAHLAAAWLATGRWDEAAAQLAPAVAVGVTGTRRVVLDVLTGILACQRGDLSVARRAADSAHTQLAGRVEGVWPSIRAWAAWLDAEIAAARDDAGSLRETSYALWRVTGLTIASDIAWRPLLVAARVEADLAASTFGRRGGERPSAPSDAGSEHMERLCEVARSLHRSGRLGQAWDAQFQAEVARFQGSAHAETWAAVADGWSELGHAHDEGWARLRAAECQVAQGDKRSAAKVLARAIALGERLRAQPLLAAVADVVRRNRLDLAAQDEGPASQRPKALALTAREIEVLALLAEGASNDEISRALFISPKTASVHVSHILAKLGARSRTEAAATAHRLRLV